jgi:hypothetical protein
LAFGAVVAFQFWSTLSGGFILLTAIGCWAVWEVIRFRRDAVRVLFRALSGLAVAGVLMVPLVLPYLAARDQHPEYAHDPGETLHYSASLRSWVSPGPGAAVARSPYRWLEDIGAPEDGDWEKHLFPGLTATLGLAGVGVAVAVRRRGRRDTGEAPALGAGLGLAVSLAVAGFVLSLGPRFEGKENGLILPFDVITRVVPGNLLRVPARFGSLALLGLGLAMALLLTRLSGRHRGTAVALVLTAILVELWPGRVPMYEAPRITSAHRAITQQPGAVLSLPAVELLPDGRVIGIFEREPQNIYLSTAHLRPTINGYSGFQPTSWWQAMQAIQDFPTASSVREMRKRGVGTVVIDTELARGTVWETTADRLDQFPGVRLVASSGAVRVYDISPVASGGSP